MPFVKLDTGILHSTLWLDRESRDIFLTALLLAEPQEFLTPSRQLEVLTLEYTGYKVPPGWYGFVGAAGPGIVAAAKMEQAVGMAALARLCSPELASRSQDFEGRRMIRIDGGYLVLNFMRYRDHDYGAKDRMRRLRQRKKPRPGVTRNSDGVTRNVTQAEAEAEAERKATTSRVRGKVDKSVDNRLPSAGPDGPPEGSESCRYCNSISGKHEEWCRVGRTKK